MKRFTFLIITVLLLFTSGCVERKTLNNDLREDSSKKEIVYNLGALPESLVMLDKKDIRQENLLMLLFNGLVKTDKDGKIEPSLAESWNISKDNIQYTFNLRKDAKWSDGSEITSEDFIKFFTEVLNKKQDNIYAEKLYSIFGARDYREKKKPFAGVAIRAVDKKTLEIRLNEPCSYFLKILAEPEFGLRNLDDNLTDWKKNYGNIKYSGAFKISGMSDRGKLDLVKNEDYYDKYEVKSDKIQITSIESNEEALAAFKTSKVNIISDPPISEVDTLIGDGEAESIPIEEGAGINFNLRKKALEDINLRKAIGCSINRELILLQDLNEVTRAASAYIPAVSDSKDKKTKEKTFFNKNGNVAESLNYMNKSNFDKKTKLKLVYLLNDENKRICSALAKNIKDVLDIDIDSIGYNEEELNDIIKNGDYDIVERDYFGAYESPVDFLEQWSSNSKLNIYGYKSPDYDSAIGKAKSEKDAGKINQYLGQCEDILSRDLPTVPIYFHNTILCTKQYIKDVYVNKEGNILLDKAYVEDNN